jgi:menaquinone-dependent protoporphyrinogen oxidase
MVSQEGNLWSVGRRDFLTFCSGLITALSLGDISGAGVSHATETEFPEGRCGEERNMKKVLVTYTSKYGSIGGVADAIGKQLGARGVATDTVLIKNADTLSSYQGVVIGSAIYMGNWMPEAVDFVKENWNILRQVPGAYFLVCMTLSRPTEMNRTKVLSYMDPLLEAVPEI